LRGGQLAVPVDGHAPEDERYPPAGRTRRRMIDPPDSLASFIERGPVADRSLAVVNRTRPRPIQEMLEELFAEQHVDVEELDVPDAEADVVLLLDDDREVIASSPLQALEEELLLVNSDLYVTGTRALEDVTMPAVLEGLAETPFRVRGYPAAHSEKLPLIAISRYIERLAWEHGAGRLRSSFQRLSRLDGSGRPTSTSTSTASRTGCRRSRSQASSTRATPGSFAPPGSSSTTRTTGTHGRRRSWPNGSATTRGRPCGRSARTACTPSTGISSARCEFDVSPRSGGRRRVPDVPVERDAAAETGK
jgi:hypothetical protein